MPRAGDEVGGSATGGGNLVGSDLAKGNGTGNGEQDTDVIDAE
jgi:hypothetical protein